MRAHAAILTGSEVGPLQGDHSTRRHRSEVHRLHRAESEVLQAVQAGEVHDNGCDFKLPFDRRSPPELEEHSRKAQEQHQGRLQDDAELAKERVGKRHGQRDRNPRYQRGSSHVDGRDYAEGPRGSR